MYNVYSDNGNVLTCSSPKWRAENAIWIGASDTKQEGNFMWTDGTPMDYTSKQCIAMTIFFYSTTATTSPHTVLSIN